MAPDREAALRFEGLQELRLLAAAGVLLFHSAHFVSLRLPAPDRVIAFFARPAFALGVQLFFGISGFVLMHALTRSSAPRFLALRCLRIYPPFLATVGLVVLGQRLLAGESMPVPWATLTLLPLGRVEYPLVVQWSLIYEVFYYVVAAALALIPRRSIARAAWMLWAAVIVVAAMRGQTSAFFPTFGSIGLSMFNLCFIGGVLAYEYRAVLLRRPLLLAMAAVIGIAGNYPNDGSVRQYLFMPIATTALVALAARGGERAMRSRWRVFLARGGDWSYGLYLLHVPVILLVLGLAGDALIARHPRSLFLVAGSAALVAGSAWGWLELEVYRRARRRLPRSGLPSRRGIP